jgi:zinc and cadmium transporter
MVLLYILLAVFSVTLISLVGIFFIGLKNNTIERFLESFVSFAVGGLLGGAFFHLLPESMESAGSSIFLYVLAGIIAFFLIENFLHWRHCHKGECDVHAFTYLNLIGDGVHNFIDGMIISAAFVTDIRLGLATTLAVAVHEIPQEIGDFGILVYGGFTKQKALLYNFFSALVAVAGAIIAYLSFNHIIWLKDFLIPFTAGGFIYIALVDLMPELHKEREPQRLIGHTLISLIGLAFMWWLRVFLE